MKALVLAGGTGSRLRPFTYSGPKQLLPIANKPVLFRALESIAATGIHDVGIVVGEHGREIRELTGDGAKFGLSITYLRQSRPLGLAHAVLIARGFLGDDDFLLHLGDNYLQQGVADFAGLAAADPAAARLLLTPVSDPSAFGVAEIDGEGNVLRLEEKPDLPRSNLALIGVYVFGPAVHRAVRAIGPSHRGELEITHAVQWMIDHGMRVRADTTARPWHDTGSVDDILEANRDVLDRLEGRIEGKVDPHSTLVGPVRVAEGAVVRRSRVVGPVVIGAGAVVSRSRIGPYTSIGEACRIEDTTIENSVLLRGAQVEGASRIAASLIGRSAVVRPAARSPQSHRLVIGDHSKVHLAS